MKGIILAGGKGTRLYPNTMAVNKQLLPIYDKPLIYYPLSLLISAGIRRILIITTPPDQFMFQRLLGDGSQWGVELHHIEQTGPRGLVEAFRLGRDFIHGEPVCLVLGDNFLHGPDLTRLLENAAQLTSGAQIFASEVDRPQEFGVVELDESGNAISLEEKPAQPRSRYAVPGLYFYDANVTELIADVQPTKNGELEMTDLNRLYMTQNQLRVEVLSPDITWLDAGTPDSLLQASLFVHRLQEQHGVMIACLEEIAHRKGFINVDKIMVQAERLKGTKYAKYLRELASV